MKVSKSRPWLFILEFLLITNAIAIAAGLGFGAALRLNRPEEPGATMLHSDQSFPPRQDYQWDSLLTHDKCS